MSEICKECNNNVVFCDNRSSSESDQVLSSQRGSVCSSVCFHESVQECGCMQTGASAEGRPGGDDSEDGQGRDHTRHRRWGQRCAHDTGTVSSYLTIQLSAPM